MSASTSAGGPRAALGIAFLGLALGYPGLYGSTSTTFILPLVREFGWGRTIPSLMYMCAALGMAVASLFLGRIVARRGEAPVVLASGLTMSAGIGALSLMNGQPALVLPICFVIGMSGAANGVGVYLALLPKFYDATLGRALAIAVVGMSVGMTLMPFISAKVIEAHGWRAGYLALACIALAATVVMTGLLSRLNSPARSGRGASRPALPGIPAAEAARSRVFWLIAISMFLLTAGVFGASVHSVPIYTDKGLAAVSIALVPVATGTGTLLGRIVCGLLLDRVFAPYIACVTGLMGAGAMLVLAFAPLPDLGYAAYVPALLIGAAMGAESDILAFAVRRYFGMRDYGAIYNRLLISYFAGALSGPLLVGVLQDRLGGPESALMVLCVLCLAFAGLSLGYGRYRFGHAPQAAPPPTVAPQDLPAG